ncbi:hypothetical protein BDBG_08721 [Blastomyces gilchristii SLH14081]|uniref:Uncharacterized protein n=1 Tax=Blastomyces gilchristii (strain SLH14081) TaxID=559298 RepID=A0A179UZP0_BLAGS|nr:uncharacterized protein BDBG_08721 [Blastomyces gilchristii SLH14081]EQL30558.1 hypothetical protein BDFG_06954 [Blastomyces dermatitidis ATCC 26199]OAT13536.1 hypothetical protein BDBG_08721 [Blastomyces gilchristii SLH14081]
MMTGNHDFQDQRQDTNLFPRKAIEIHQWFLCISSRRRRQWYKLLAGNHKKGHESTTLGLHFSLVHEYHAAGGHWHEHAFGSNDETPRHYHIDDRQELMKDVDPLGNPGARLPLAGPWVKCMCIDRVLEIESVYFFPFYPIDMTIGPIIRPSVQMQYYSWEWCQGFLV